MLPIGNIGILLLILGLVLLLVSIVPSPLKADLRYVGAVLLVVGAIIYVLLIVLA